MWTDGTIVSFDTETTGVDPETARIVTASVVVIDGATGKYETHEWLADPGVDIPDEAAKVHGITTEHAREHGVVIKLWKRRRWIVANLLNWSALTCWADLASWAANGGVLDHNRGPQCRAESIGHRDKSCWCGKFRDGKTATEAGRG